VERRLGRVFPGEIVEQRGEVDDRLKAVGAARIPDTDVMRSGGRSR